MKTLYEVLEVSENASKEIIEKAYRTLAKKYHPDLQPEENKQMAEKKMKEINEAYDILGDEEKRKAYNSKLALDRQEQKQAYNMPQKPMAQTQYQQAKQREQEEVKRQQKMRQEMQANMQAKYEQKYQQAYEDYLRDLGYKIKYKWTWKRLRDFVITLLIIAGICTILWLFPPTHQFIMDFYHSNSIIKTIIDVIGGILQGIWNAICSIFNWNGNTF